jgi:hypothetical protein
LEGTPNFSDLVTMGTLAKGDTIRSYDEINWVPEGWTRPELLAVFKELMAISIHVYPLRFEWIFSKYSKVGQGIQALFGDSVRHKGFILASRMRRRISEFWFSQMHAQEIANRVAAIDITVPGKKDTKGLEQHMIQIMNHSDELKTKANEFLQAQAKEKGLHQTLGTKVGT